MNPKWYFLYQTKFVSHCYFPIYKSTKNIFDKQALNLLVHTKFIQSHINKIKSPYDIMKKLETVVNKLWNGGHFESKSSIYPPFYWVGLVTKKNETCYLCCVACGPWGIYGRVNLQCVFSRQALQCAMFWFSLKLA